MKTWDEGYDDGYGGNVEKRGLFYGQQYHLGYQEGEEDAALFDRIYVAYKVCNCSVECATKYIDIPLSVLQDIVAKFDIVCP
jgi:hypothetical protein